MFNLEEIKDPSFVKNLNKKEMEQLAKEIRCFLIDNLSKTGGHLASNLGIVELTIALHKMFDSPKDKFVFDVGHQTYTHKILTGRAKDFKTLRKINGLSGFASREESPHDHFGAGHSSTSISAISGFLCNDEGYDIAIIGDGALSGGEAFEGLNYLGSVKNKKAIVVLNDNNMAISESVGAMHQLLKKIRGNGTGVRLKKKMYKILPNFLIRFCQLIMRLYKMIFRISNLFEDMGFLYMGPVDGNDIDSLLKVLKRAKKCGKPCVVHIFTEKGKGYEPAESDPEGAYHGVEPFDISSGKPLYKETRPTWSEIISEGIISLEKEMNIRVIVPAMIGGSKLNRFRELYPDKLIDVGIAEEHALTMAAAASLNGEKVFVPIYSTFAQRGYDQILHDIARHNTNVVIGIDRAGIVGHDGETHQGIYDVAMMSHIPNMTILHPCNPEEAWGLLEYAFQQKGPVAIRYPRDYFSCDVRNIKKETITQKWVKIKDGSKLIVISYGRQLQSILEKTKDLDITIVNARFIKPMDEKMLDELFMKNVKIFCIEEVVDTSSLAMDIAYYASKKHVTIDLEAINFGDRFVPHGSIYDIKKAYGLDNESIEERIMKCA